VAIGAPLRTLATAGIAAGALAVPAGASAAPLDIGGGATTLKLNAATAKVLSANGVKVAPVKPARAAGGSIAFPITRGSVTLPERGSIAHSGGLRISAGGRKLVVRRFIIRLGAHPYLSAAVGKARVRLLDLSLAKAKLGRAGLAYTVTGVRATLARPAARALNATFGVSLFRRGIPIGRASVRALPKTLALAGGTTSLALDPGTASALTSLGVTAAPLAPATAGAAGLAFPITGGALNAKTLAGSATHSGGIRLSKGATAVDLRNFTIRVKKSPDLTAEVGNARVSILSLDLSKAKVATKGRTVTVSGVVASLTAGAATALNQAFGTTAFAAGLKVGTATVAAKVK
jgi:hypothetical protein